MKMHINIEKKSIVVLLALLSILAFGIFAVAQGQSLRPRTPGAHFADYIVISGPNGEEIKLSDYLQQLRDGQLPATPQATPTSGCLELISKANDDLGAWAVDVPEICRNNNICHVTLYSPSPNTEYSFTYTQN